MYLKIIVQKGTCIYLFTVDHTYIVRPESPCRLLARSHTRIDTRRASSNLARARHVNAGNHAGCAIARAITRA